MESGGLINQGRSNTLCSECQTGVMRLQHITYFTWLHKELVTAPNFPAWVCDVCGRREYDNRAIVWLNTLLNHESGSQRSNTSPNMEISRTDQPGT